VDEAEAHSGEAKGSSNWLSGSLGGGRAQLPVAPSSFPAICHLNHFFKKNSQHDMSMKIVVDMFFSHELANHEF
jgi:hypothetical protein